ncbi:MAG: redoxin domain-containing protein [Pirellulales bacterium]|nr:redoxin domain-containing protein [Pirellulales bacterium]
MLTIGDPAIWFVARSTVNPKFHFDTVAGRYVVLTFFGSTRLPASAQMLADVEAAQEDFDGERAVFLGVSCDPGDEARVGAALISPGIIFFADFDAQIARAYGIVDAAGNMQPTTFVLDEGLRVVAVVPLLGDGRGHVAQVLERVASFPELVDSSRSAPVLILDRVFEPELCRTLIEVYEQQGGTDSGFMRDIGGKTTGVYDYSFKRRSDCEIVDQGLVRTIHQRLSARVVPEIRKAFNFAVTRIERHIVACYDSEWGGHFRPHRDNTSIGTAHRRFAVSINLNSEEFTGGDLRFPEFGLRTYRPTTGGAVVFGCSLLHEATAVKTGKRFAFLPFLYDEAAAQIRDQNRQNIAAESIDLNRPS